ncbi:hypothetical protein [Mangrovimonas futianensis]|uniref:hypothetical protein n=1 Tax=Mangrovimonas futianensis TaxID=2895523 RepID=UPI001E3F485B|nr:hypothetical protein [Mangrovimonas futianensis]MCF1421428.1 hypothetical protein [Mangrovimonas futianensis]
MKHLFLLFIFSITCQTISLGQKSETVSDFTAFEPIYLHLKESPNVIFKRFNELHSQSIDSIFKKDYKTYHVQNVLSQEKLESLKISENDVDRFFKSLETQNQEVTLYSNWDSQGSTGINDHIILMKVTTKGYVRKEGSGTPPYYKTKIALAFYNLNLNQLEYYEESNYFPWLYDGMFKKYKKQLKKIFQNYQDHLEQKE